jgi:uncharacterized membrane protein HdeD (DUF308 family)
VNPNVKTFTAIFFFIWGVVGVVLAVANLSQRPMAVTSGVVFAVVGLLGFIAGWLMLRRPRY